MTHRRAPRRRGVTLVIALVMLAVVSALGGAMLTRASLHRRNAERAACRLQADWLAESGLSRAVARLSTEPDYQNEVWLVPAVVLEGRPGRVEIMVTRDEPSPGRRSIVATADYPHDPGRPDARVRSSRRIVLDR